MSGVSVAQIAIALAISERGVRLRADRGCWPSLQGEGKGSPRLFQIADLPKDVRDALMRRRLGERSAVPATTATSSATTATPAEPVELQPESDLKDWQREIMRARVTLVREVDRLARDGGMMHAIEMIVADAAAGTLPAPLQRAAEKANARKGGSGRMLSVTSLRRWRDELSEAGGATTAVAPRPSPKAQALPPAWMADFLDVYAVPSKPSIASAARELARLRPEIALPPTRTVQHAIAKLPAIERARGRLGPRALRQLRAFVRRDVSGLWPTAVYSTDGHTHHRSVQHPITGHAFRPEITTTIDIVTRRIVGWSAALSENTWGTIGALRHAFEASGVCDIWYIDRGKGFNNHVFDDDLTGLLARFDVEKQNSLPYRSQARGVIERLHQFWIERARFSPAYLGVDMDPEARKRFDVTVKAEIAVTGAASSLQRWDEFLAECEADVEIYNNRPHSTLGKKSPAQVWAEWEARGWRADRLDPRETEWMFRPQERRQTRRGEIQLFTNRYFAIELEEFHECDVLVGYDIHDASRVWVSTLDQRLICEARFHGNSVSYFPVTHVQQAHERRVAGRLERVEKRRKAVEAERIIPTLDFSRTPAPIAAPAAPILPVITTTAQAAAPAANDARPRFESDVDYAVWLRAHPQNITSGDARYLLERVAGRSAFRTRLEMEGVDVAAFELVLKSRRSEALTS